VSREEDPGDRDIEAALETRQFGARYDAELVDGFAERIERAVELRHASGSEGRRRQRPAPAPGLTVATPLRRGCSGGAWH
jgi:hypothetical protein